MGMFFSVVSVAAVAVWSAVAVERYLGSRMSRNRSSAAVEEKWAAIHWIIVLAWAFDVIPSAIGLVQVGRGEPQFAATTATRLQAESATVLSVMLVLLCGRLIIRHLHDAPAFSVWRLAAFLAPWFAIEIVSGIAAGYVSGRQFIVYPLVGIAIWVSSPPVAVARTVGILGAVTAGMSIVLAFVTPLVLVDGGPAGAGKAIVGNGSQLLAGPYSDANGFALTLALAAPCALLIRRPLMRTGALALIGAALLWSAGRTSIIAMAVGLTVYVLVRQRSVFARRGIATATVILGAALVVGTPFIDRTPAAFSMRGLVWSLSVSSWRSHHFWLGGGPLSYERGALAYDPFSFKIIAGHNLVVDSLVRGGVVGLAALALLLIVVVRHALRLASVNAFPIVFLITFIYISWLEVPLNLANLGFLGYASWLPLAVICFAKGDSAQSQRQSGADDALLVAAAI